MRLRKRDPLYMFDVFEFLCARVASQAEPRERSRRAVRRQSEAYLSALVGKREAPLVARFGGGSGGDLCTVGARGALSGPWTGGERVWRRSGRVPAPLQAASDFARARGPASPLFSFSLNYGGCVWHTVYLSVRGSSGPPAGKRWLLGVVVPAPPDAG